MIDSIRDKVGRVEGWSEEDFRQNLVSNLGKGDFNLIIAVDSLNDELKRIIQFINSRGANSPQIHALEIKQFETSNLQMIVPEMFGTVTPPPPPPQHWDEISFFNAVNQSVDIKEADVIKKLCDFTKKNADQLAWGRGKTVGSFVFRKNKNGVLVSIFAIFSNGSGYIAFGDLVGRGVKEDVIQDFRATLNQIPEMRFPGGAVNALKFPSFNISALTTDQFLETFERAVLALCEQIEL